MARQKTANSGKAENKNLNSNSDQTIIAPGVTDPFIGKTIGNCEIQEKINEGGTAYIYRAFNTRFELDRVIKILKPSLSDEEDFFLRFTQEAQLTARLDHPNILRVFDTGQVDGFFYIEMEHITGQTLRSYLQSLPRLSERDVLHIASQVVKALDYAHTARLETSKGEITGILHRDLKPENIMLTSNRTVKLMDFGAAKPLNITSNTMQGMIVGTFHYMSPEQLEGKRLDVRSDFFSLGIVLYELLTGQKPFVASNLTKLIEKISACKYERPGKLRPSLSSMTEELVEQLLSKNRDHRPKSAKQIDENLQICIQSFNSWAAGKKVRVPFSVKRYFPAISMAVSLCALGVSLLSLYLRPPAGRESAPRTYAEKESQISLLEKGRELERKGMYHEASNIYELVPSVKENGIANEYLEAQIRRAHISFKHLNQYTRARSILEKLRLNYSDPAIDAYLGQIYFHLALYIEARDRLDAALSSKKGSVIPQGKDLRRELLYYYANALDRQYTYVERNSSLLMEARKAWDYYIEFSECAAESGDKQCKEAFGRRKELERIANDEAANRE